MKVLRSSRPSWHCCAAGNVKQNRFDEVGRRIQTIDKLGSAAKNYYNTDGTLARSIDRNGNTFTYTYDVRGNLIAQSDAEETVTFTVDRLGKRTSMTDRTGTTAYAYDEATDQLKQITYPDRLQTTFEYDISGRRTSMTGPFGTTVYYGHDAMNRLTSVGTSLNTPDTQYNYQRNGLMREANSQNGVQTQTEYRGLDLVGLNQVRNQETLKRYAYGYDENKNIVNRTQDDATDTFSYDQLDRILTSTVNQDEYTYDRQGNRLTLSSQADPDLSASDYTYDKKNRLTAAAKNGAQVNYTYNGDNLLVERAENGKVTRYYYDDAAQIIAEAQVVNGAPTLKANYIRGAQLEAIQYADGSKAYVESNGHGDITELRDEQGVLLNRYTYDIWGNILTKEEKVHNPFRYSGELWDDTTNLQYLRARWYDPSMGRFINEDTYEGQLNNSLSLNPYTYVINNPLKYADPTGHRHEEGSGWVGFPGNKYSATDPWKGWGGPVGSIINFFILDDVNTLRDENSSTLAKALAVAGLIPLATVLKGSNLVLKVGTKEGAIVNKEFKLTSNVLEVAKKACNCFTAGTQIETNEGEKNIEDIKVGDKVLSKNEKTGEQTYKEVTTLHRNKKDITYKLFIEDQIIETTDNHPFWVDGKGWVLSIDLKVGDELLQSNGNRLKIKDIEVIHYHDKIEVYNFTVADFHTYFVSDLEIWVHNINEFCGTGSDLANLAKHSTKSIDGLPDVKVSAEIVNSAAIEFVGSGAKIKMVNGGMVYTSKKGDKIVRTGVKYRKSNQQGSEVYEANFETYSEKGDKLYNYHVDMK